MARGESVGQVVTDASRSALDAYGCEGAQQILQKALACEVEAFLADHANRTNQRGRKHVIRNGYLPGRTIMTGLGRSRLSSREHGTSLGTPTSG